MTAVQEEDAVTVLLSARDLTAAGVLARRLHHLCVVIAGFGA